MNSKNAKDLRKQLRQIVQEILPEVLKNELFQALQVENKIRLEAISQSVKDTLAQMDDRSKDVQSFIMRQVVAQQPVPASEDVSPISKS